MQLEVGAILEGKITGITKFGAFVELGEGKTGMVHISEVAPTFVKEITDFVSEGQTVKVKRQWKLCRLPVKIRSVHVPAEKVPIILNGPIKKMKQPVLRIC